MDITEQDIRSIVEKVVSTINVKPAGDLVPPEVSEDQPGGRRKKRIKISWV